MYRFTCPYKVIFLNIITQRIPVNTIVLMIIERFSEALSKLRRAVIIKYNPDPNELIRDSAYVLISESTDSFTFIEDIIPIIPLAI